MDKVFVILIPFVGLALGNVALLLGRRLMRSRSDAAIKEAVEAALAEETYAEHLIFTKHLALSHWHGTYLLSLSALLQWVLLQHYTMVGVSALLVVLGVPLGLWMGRWSPRYYRDGRPCGLPQPLLLVIGFNLAVLAATAAAIAKATLY